MLHLEGTKDLPQPAPDLASKLGDARFLVQCVPGIEKVLRDEPDQAACILRPGFAFVRGTLEVSLHVVPGTDDTTGRVLLHSKGIGSTSDVEAQWTLLPRENGTQVHWTADVKELGGLLKAVPQGLVKAAAQKVIEDAWSAVEIRLAQS